YFYVLGQLSQSHIAITTINFYIYDTASGQTAAAGMGQGFNASLGAIEVVPVIVTPHRNISVEDFAIGPGDFSILGVSPSLPRDVPYGTNDTFVLELKLPYESYYGPINITYSIG
ncbi:MAG: hypothetical protein KGH49_03595, partial [Candidatus Micrarchaeota archaeon]|nr:hypothetical protein [Candidatus Micrarchaeota archaeon]